MQVGGCGFQKSRGVRHLAFLRNGYNEAGLTVCVFYEINRMVRALEVFLLKILLFNS